MRGLVDGVDEGQPVVVVPDAQGEAGDQDQASEQAGARAERSARGAAGPAGRGSSARVREVEPLVSLTRESTWLRERHPNARDHGQRARRAPPPQGHRARRTRRAARRAPTRMVGAVVVKDGRVIGEGFTQPPGAGARRAHGAGRLRGGPAGRDALRLARALRAPRPHAALHRRDPRGRHRPRGDRLRRPHRQGLRPRPGDPARRGRGGGRASTASVADAARLLNQPFRKHARTGRPLVVFKSAMTLDGKVATAHRRLAVDLRRGQPRARAPLARGVGRGGGGHRHRAARRPAAHGPHRRRRPPAAPRGVRLGGPAAARQPARAAAWPRCP